MSPDRTYTAILAGGTGSRMGGDKPWRLVKGRRLIDIALEKACRVCPPCLVVTGEVERFADLDCRILADRWPGQGPMAAMATAFLDSDADSLLLLPVDAPLVRTELLSMILELSKGQKAVAAQGPGGHEPLLAWYHRDCLPAALRLVQAGERRLRLLLQEVGAYIMTRQQVAQADPGDLSFINVNTPDDLQRAERLATESGFFDTHAG